MSADTVQQIKDRLSIVDVVSPYVKLERSGASLRARCPFHAERSPSFFVSPDRGTYHCFGCGVGGDMFSFVEAIEGMDFKGALKILAEKAGVELVYNRSGDKGARDERDRLFELLEAATIFYASHLTDPAQAYLHERGVTDATIQSFRLGFAGEAWSAASDFLKAKKFSENDIVTAGLAKKNERSGLTDKFRNRILFPIADSAGRVVGFSGRIFGADAHPDAPKYLNSPETPLFQKSKILYGFDRAKQVMRKNNCAVLVEGQVDLIMSHQAGWGNTVAVSGTAFTAEHAGLIRRMTDNLLIALDADAAGIKAAGRAARAALASGLNVKVARLPSGLDPADLILRQGADAWKQAIRDAEDIIAFLLAVLAEHVPQPDRFRRAVYESVLPFVADVHEPLKREQYVRLIAGKIGASEGVVVEALARVPVASSAQGKDPFTRPMSLNRAKQAYAIYLWQKTVRGGIDSAAYLQKLERAVGSRLYAELLALSADEQESLRFSAERLHGGSASIAAEIDILLQTLTRDRLADELAAVMSALKRAESAGDEAEITRLTQSTKELSGRIAESK